MRTQVSRETLFTALGAGFVAGLVFFFFLSQQGGGLMLVFLPGFPLLLAGMALGAVPGAWAALVAFLLADLLTGLSGAVFFGAFIALPCYYFIRRALLWREAADGRTWYPALRLLSELTVILATGLMLLALATQKLGGLQALIPHDFADSFKNTDPEFAAMAQHMLGEWSFMLFALMGWLWVIMFYALAVLANRLLGLKSHALRPSLALHSGGIPAGILVLLLLSGALSLAGAGLDRYTAQTLFILLLLPYLLSGLASVHAFATHRHIPLRKAWLACFYIALACIRWPLLGVIAIGLYTQLAEILDRHKKIG